MSYASIYIKYLFMLLCSFYLFSKLLNLTISKKTFWGSILFSVLIAFPFLYIRSHFRSISLFILIALFFIATKFLYHVMLNTALFSSIISFGISYFLFCISDFLALPILFLLVYFTKDKSLQHFLYSFPVCFIQLVLATIPFHSQRLKNGMPTLLQQGASDTGIFISLLIVMTASIASLYPKNDLLFTIPIFMIVICGFLLFTWWKRSITQKYKKMLQKQEIEALIYANESLQKEMEMLKKDNDSLSGIIHKDNKLIPAMELAVSELLSASQTSDPDIDLKTKAASLLQELQRLTEERKGILLSYEQDAIYSVSSGLTRFDAIIHYMGRKCHLNKIAFNVSLNADILYLTRHIIDEADLCTLTADLLENAMIACLNQPTKNLLLVIGMENQHYCLNVFDSGIPFKTDTIKFMGKIRTTTHSDTGGSGIGLISTFEIAKKYKASFYIEEITNTSMYTKKISFCFDDLYIFNAYGNRIIQ